MNDSTWRAERNYADDRSSNQTHWPANSPREQGRIPTVSAQGRINDQLTRRIWHRSTSKSFQHPHVAVADVAADGEIPAVRGWNASDSAAAAALPQHPGVPFKVPVPKRVASNRSRPAVYAFPVSRPIKTRDVRPTGWSQSPRRRWRMTGRPSESQRSSRAKRIVISWRGPSHRASHTSTKRGKSKASLIAP